MSEALTLWSSSLEFERDLGPLLLGGDEDMRDRCLKGLRMAGRYRKRGESVRLASDAYFFEEGTWKDYAGTRFGEIRVIEKGDAVLTGLRDSEGERLGPPLH